MQRIFWGCDIGRFAKISKSAKFAHGALGVVVNNSAIIEDGCIIQQHVTIGSNQKSNEAPIIHKNVFIGAYAMIIGKVEIGENSIIGAGTVVFHDIPPNTKVIGEYTYHSTNLPPK